MDGGGAPPPGGARFVYAPTLGDFELAEGHPFRPLRIELVRDLLRDGGILDDADEIPVPPLDEARLLRVHEPGYVRAVRAASRGRAPEGVQRWGLGTSDNPIFPGMHEAYAGTCAATLEAVERVASGDATRVLSAAGGLHHAMPGRASGFCVYNDLAVAIDHAVRGHGLRVAYVDLDAHHGDGVQEIFYEDPSVLTLSVHESGRYLFPGTGRTWECGRGPGRGTSVNVPLEPFTEDESFLECLDAVAPRAFEAFRPDLVVLQAGADAHRHDPLADLSLSLAGMRAAFERVRALADRWCGGRIVATGGGGYDAFRTAPRAWAHLWSVLSDRPLPDPLPETWRERWAPHAPHPLPRRAFDDEPLPPVARRVEISARNRLVTRRLLEALEPIWEETGPPERS